MKRHCDKIKKLFRDKLFGIGDLAGKLGIKRSTAYWIMREMIKNEYAVRIMKGTYKLANPKIVAPSKDVERIKAHLLNRLTRRFAFTGLSVLEQFIHHMPYVIIYHLFVEPGSSEEFKSEIKAPRDAAVLINPAINEIELMLNNTKIKRLIVIRENNYFYSSKQGLASIESAFVDLFFEVTRDKIPFIKTDLDEILKSLALNSMINYSRLLKYAKIRGIKDEIKSFLRRVSGSIKIPVGALK